MFNLLVRYSIKSYPDKKSRGPQNDYKLLLLKFLLTRWAARLRLVFLGLVNTNYKSSHKESNDNLRGSDSVLTGVAAPSVTSCGCAVVSCEP